MRTWDYEPYKSKLSSLVNIYMFLFLYIDDIFYGINFLLCDSNCTTYTFFQDRIPLPKDITGSLVNG